MGSVGTQLKFAGTRVIFVINSLRSGGAEKQLLWIGRTLVEAGVPCAVFELVRSEGNLRMARLVNETEKAGVEMFRGKPNGGYMGSWLRLRAFLIAHPSAVVWTWGFRSDLLVYSLVLRRFHPGWICSLRTANWEGLRNLRFMLRMYGSKVSVFASNTVTGREMIGQLYPSAANRGRVINNVVPETETEAVILQETVALPLRVMMLGNIIDLKKKGYDLVLQLAEMLRQEDIPAEIHVAGRSDLDRQFEREIERRNLTGYLNYHGEAGDPQQFLRSGHCFLLASRYEGMPNALLEAMAIGLPSIATRVGDLERIAQDRRELRLVGIEDAVAIKKCLTDILEDWPAAVAMGERGRRWCKATFADERCREQLFEVVRTATRRE